LTQKQNKIIKPLLSSLKSSFDNLFLPKNLKELVELSKIFILIPVRLIQLSSIAFIPLILFSWLSNFVIETQFGIIAFGLIYTYFLLAFNLLIWFIIPPGVIILLSKLFK
tara:strand:+ start:429 stop:758 length:330 start_codon:yes stop_codon:yes gene_type:complete